MPDFTNAFLQGQAAGRQIRLQTAKDSALKRYAGGDTQGGVDDLMAVDPDAAFALQDRATRMDAGHKLASGDSAGAMQAAYAGGNIEAGGAIQQQLLNLNANQRAVAKEHASTIASIGIKLKTQDPGTWGATLAALKPALIDRGFQPEEVDQAIASITADPSGRTLDGLIGQSLDVKDQLDMAEKQAALAETTRHNKEIEGRPLVVGDGGMLFGPRGGGVLANNPKNFAPKTGKAGGAGSHELPAGFVVHP